MRGPLKHSNETKPSRDLWIDVSKGLCIILVVFAHSLGSVIQRFSTPPFAQVLYESIYMFHMSVFFFLSGFHLERLIGRGFKKFFVQRLGLLAYPHVLWGLIFWAATIVFAKWVSTEIQPGMPWRLFYDLSVGEWFLSTMFVLTVGYSLVRQAKVPPIFILAVSLIAYAWSRFKGYSLWNPEQVFSWYGSWLVAGVVANSLIPRITFKLKSIALAAVALVGFGFLLATAQPGPPVPFTYPLRALAGLVMTIGVALLISRNAQSLATRLLNYLGQCSLEIYLASGLFASASRVFFFNFLHIHNVYFLVITQTLGGMVGAWSLVVLFRRLNFPYAFRLKLQEKAKPVASLPANVIPITRKARSTPRDRKNKMGLK